jgi:transcriptional regulator with XRE-family HTH domain
MVDELGNLLREAREAKGLTLAEVQEETRISRKFLDALENGQFESLPTSVHVRGYLRNYARYLNLDPEPLLDRYELSRANGPAPVAVRSEEDFSNFKQLSPLDDQPFFDPVNVELSGSGGRESSSLLRIIIILALVVTIALIANRFIPILTGNGDGTEALTANLEDAIGSITAETSEAATATPDVLMAEGAGEAIVSTERNDAVQIPTLTATRPVLPATFETINLRLDITERTWMRVTIDDQVVFEGLARSTDEPYLWEAQQEAVLLTGNAIGVFVTINDIELGKLGGRGEVVEEIWTTTGSE